MLTLPSFNTLTLLDAGLVAAALAGILAAYAAAASTGDRRDIERSLRLLDDTIAKRTAIKHKAEVRVPLGRRLLRGLVPIGKRTVLPSSLMDMEQQINFAGNPVFWSIDNILAMKVVSLTVGGLLAFGFIGTAGQLGLVLGVLIALLGYEAPDLIIRQMADRKSTRLNSSH